jgi:hypothetical protein
MHLVQPRLGLAVRSTARPASGSVIIVTVALSQHSAADGLRMTMEIKGSSLLFHVLDLPYATLCKVTAQ